MYGGERASRDLSLERAKSDRYVHRTPLRQHSMCHSCTQSQLSVEFSYHHGQISDSQLFPCMGKHMTARYPIIEGPVQ